MLSSICHIPVISLYINAIVGLTGPSHLITLVNNRAESTVCIVSSQHPVSVVPKPVVFLYIVLLLLNLVRSLIIVSLTQDHPPQYM